MQSAKKEACINECLIENLRNIILQSSYIKADIAKRLNIQLDTLNNLLGRGVHAKLSPDTLQSIQENFHYLSNVQYH